VLGCRCPPVHLVNMNPCSSQHGAASLSSALRMRWRMFLERREQPFVLAVKSDESLWTLTERGPAQVRADELLASEMRPGGWRRLSAGAGSKDERLYEWALVPLFRLQLSEEERAWGHWLLARRGIADPDEIA
jgi:hypothetical protein